MNAMDRTKYADYAFLIFLAIAGIFYWLSGVFPEYKDVLSDFVGAMILAAIASFAILTVIPLAISAFGKTRVGLSRLEKYSYLVLLAIAAFTIIAEVLDTELIAYLGAVIVGIAYILAYAREIKGAEA